MSISTSFVVTIFGSSTRYAILFAMTTKNLSDELTWRGFVNQTTYKSITELDKDPITFYWGVDPSASSMTIGNLAAAMMVRHFIQHGHKAILLVGGATGLIGDPDGKSQERDLKSTDEIATNKAGIIDQYKSIFDGLPFDIVDNYDWFNGLGYMDFLRDIGKHVPMRQMLNREFVQSRLREGGAGISYAEFSYSLIQGYDFLHLFKEKGVTLQLCGADQWGNCIAGVDLIRRLTKKEAHIWSTPLIINKASGQKFGKSEDGAIWLDPNMTSVYKFYQFWLNVDDDGVEDYLKIYTVLESDHVSKVVAEFNANRADRLAQKTLAYEVTKLIHGEDAAKSVTRVSEVLFGHSDYSQLSDNDFELLNRELPVVEIKNSQDIIDVLVEGNLASSKSEARRFLESNAIYINGQQIPLSKTKLDKADSLHGYIFIRRGKNAQILVKVS